MRAVPLGLAGALTAGLAVAPVLAVACGFAARVAAESGFLAAGERAAVCVVAGVASLVVALLVGFGGGAASPKLTGASSCSAAFGTARPVAQQSDNPAAARHRHGVETFFLMGKPLDISLSAPVPRVGCRAAGTALIADR
ncbi:hypothetical protein [Accumulibacter sp.]|uniref:hypothetical protein n=1 Tax=Accumulibacter sp. TaxID=2053492 RepID=UPI00261739B6|nr:hypothetical protein [Accumulibacter sp.]